MCLAPIRGIPVAGFQQGSTEHEFTRPLAIAWFCLDPLVEAEAAERRTRAAELW